MWKSIIASLLLLLTSAAIGEEAAPPMLPSDAMSEQELRTQLAKARTINAQLQQEREVLQKQLAEVEAQIAADDRRLKSVMKEPSNDPQIPWGPVSVVAAVLLLAGGSFGYWRVRRHRSSKRKPQ